MYDIAWDAIKIISSYEIIFYFFKLYFSTECILWILSGILNKKKTHYSWKLYSTFVIFTYYFTIIIFTLKRETINNHILNLEQNLGCICEMK